MGKALMKPVKNLSTITRFLTVKCCHTQPYTAQLVPCLHSHIEIDLSQENWRIANVHVLCSFDDNLIFPSLGCRGKQENENISSIIIQHTERKVFSLCPCQAIDPP